MCRNHSCLNVSSTSTSILIGWDVKNKKPATLTSQMGTEECKTMLKENGNIVPCWYINEDSKTFAFLKFDDKTHAILSICTYNANNTSTWYALPLCYASVSGNDVKKVTREKWNPHTRRILDSIAQDSLHECALQVDESNGHLWIIVNKTYFVFMSLLYDRYCEELLTNKNLVLSLLAHTRWMGVFQAYTCKTIRQKEKSN